MSITDPLSNPHIYAWVETLCKYYNEDEIVEQIMNKINISQSVARELLQDVGAVIVATEEPELWDK